jgi:hypothetical protein
MLVIRAWPNLTVVLEQRVAKAPRISPYQTGPLCAKSAVKILKFIFVIHARPKRIVVMEFLNAMVPIPPRANSAGLAVDQPLTKGNVKMEPLGSDHLCARLSNSPSALGVAAK